ncbi:hypothetical protein B0I37DRAFT_428192 [Chaetomium sp. MPI-CAGE-AT-0009]|nr:hypothetical protein B0I37DRAFT_428192 [Chaetomium sp. MPI-CAGE-AT-0009]
MSSKTSASANTPMLEQHQPLDRTSHSKRRRCPPTPGRCIAKGEPQANVTPFIVDHLPQAVQPIVEEYNTNGGEDDGDAEFYIADISDDEDAELFDDVPDEDDDNTELSPVQQEVPSSPAAFVVDRNGHIRVGPQPMKLRPFVRTAAAKAADVHLRYRIQANMDTRDAKFVSRQDVERQKQGILDDMPGRLLTHKHDRVYAVQIEQWKKWAPEKQRAVLDHLRTGVFGPVIQDQLDGWTIRDLFTGDSFTSERHNSTAPTSHSYWKGVYRWLIRIAEKHGLTREEFEYYGTVSVPDSPDGRVFFPFHVLARAQAEGMSWGWRTTFVIARSMLHQMREACNRHAERAGFGEQEMDPLRLIYWWCHHLCKKIQRVKSERPSGTQEEIAFYLLDRWGLPIVPWVGNILKASLCKDQDHGVAMRFGLCLPRKGEDFDPVEHWDDFLCTVTVDSQATNMAMRDFSAASWDSIRHALSRVPCTHPFWRVDADLGLRCWISTWDEPLATRPLPIPVPAMPITPIEPWLGVAASPQHYQCTECPGVVGFPTAGLLLRHYQDSHWGWPTTAEMTDAAQDSVDEAYWEEMRERLRCKEPGCGKICATAGSLRRHVETMHAVTRPIFPCTQPGCDKVYLDPANLQLHVKTKHSEVPPEYPCKEPGCGRIFTTAGNLHNHALIHAAGPGGFPCLEPGCGRTYSSPNSLHEHVRTKHSTAPPVYPCTEPGCGKTFTTAGTLRRHVRELHAAVTPTFACKEPGCDRVYTSADNLRRHVRDDHAAVPKVHACDAPNCGKTFSNSSNLRAHVKAKHSGAPPSFTCTEPGCGATFNRNANLRSHVRNKHPERAVG